MCPPAGHGVKHPLQLQGTRSFLKGQRTAARKHRPDLSSSWPRRRWQEPRPVTPGAGAAPAAPQLRALPVPEPRARHRDPACAAQVTRTQRRSAGLAQACGLTAPPQFLPLVRQPTPARTPGTSSQGCSAAKIPPGWSQSDSPVQSGMGREKQPPTLHTPQRPPRPPRGFGMGMSLDAGWDSGHGGALKPGEQSHFSGVSPPDAGAAALQREGAGPWCSEDANSLFVLLRQLLPSVGKRPPSPRSPGHATRSQHWGRCWPLEPCHPCVTRVSPACHPASRSPPSWRAPTDPTVLRLPRRPFWPGVPKPPTNPAFRFPAPSLR